MDRLSRLVAMDHLVRSCVIVGIFMNYYVFHQSVHANLVKFNLSIPHVQNCLAPVVCECRAYHTQSSHGLSARRTVAMVHTQGEHLYLEVLVKGSSYNVTAVLSEIKMHKDKHHMLPKYVT